MPNLTRAAAYARYSTDKQTENSIAYQINKISEYAQKNNVEIVQVYADEACSGTNTDRDAFRRLMSDAAAHKFDAVIVYEMSRGARDIGDWFNFRHTMLQLHIDVISCSENLGSMLDPNAFFFEAITAAKGQLDVLQIRQRSIAGTAERAKQGQFLGGVAPLGYDIKNGEYIINPVECATVKKIFEMYAAGASYNNIIDALDGARGKRGQLLGKNSLSSILTNERYIGVYTWNKRHVKLLRKWAGGTPNPNAVRMDGVIPPIIDIDLWEKVRNRMDNNKHTKGTSHSRRSYMLTGLIFCEKCGAPYCGHTSVNTRGYAHTTYICNNKSQLHNCDAPNVPATELETFIVQNVKDWLLRTNFDDLAREIADRVNSSAPDLSAERAELAAIRAKINNGVKAVLSGMAFPELTAEMDRLRARADELTAAIDAASANRPHVEPAQIVAMLQNATENWTVENVPNIIKQFVQKIYANSDGTVSVEIGVQTDGCGSVQQSVCTTILFVPAKLQRTK